MKKKASIIARVFLFACTVVWVMGFITTSIYFFPVVLDSVRGESLAVRAIIPTWYIITLVLIGTWAPYKGFRIVGKWEKKEDKKEG